MLRATVIAFCFDSMRESVPVDHNIKKRRLLKTESLLELMTLWQPKD